MGGAGCSSFCERGTSERIGCETWSVASTSRGDCLSYRCEPGADGCAWAPLEAGEPLEELSGLGYMPPPRPEVAKGGDMVVGTEVPKRPPAGKVHGVPPSLAGSSSRYSTSRYPTCARPGEPVNQVFVQFSNDLEGFLPYTLVISEEHGLEFTSLAPTPDFVLDPLIIMKVIRVPYDALMEDTYFINLSKSVLARPGKISSATSPQPFAVSGGIPEQERVRPPYYSVVQLSVRRTILEGGLVLVFIAVQSEPLAEELVRSCNQLKKRRACRFNANKEAPEGGVDQQEQSVSRGCLSARSLGMRTPPGVSPARTPQGVSPARTPAQGVSPARTPARSPRRSTKQSNVH